MSRKNFFNFKNIFSFAIVVLLIVVTITLIMLNKEPVYNDDYFKSDNSKLVTYMGTTYYEGDEDDPDPEAAYMVYYYTGTKITDVKIFYKFESDEIAKGVLEKVQNEHNDWIREKKTSRNYLIFSLRESEFDSLTVDQVKDFTDE